MTRVVTAALMLGLLLAPSVRSVAAADETAPVPAPFGVECPPVEVVNGVNVIPEGAPAECVYIQTIGAEDPCAPDAAGVQVTQPLASQAAGSTQRKPKPPKPHAAAWASPPPPPKPPPLQRRRPLAVRPSPPRRSEPPRLKPGVGVCRMNTYFPMHT